MKRAARFCFAISDAIASKSSEELNSAVEKALRGNENRVDEYHAIALVVPSEGQTPRHAPSEVREALGLELGHARRRFARDGAEEFLVPLGFARGRERPREVRQALVREPIESFIGRPRNIVEELLL